MSDLRTERHDEPPLTQVERIDRACDRFEAQWRAGLGPAVEAFLLDAPEAERPALLRELRALEAELRGGAAPPQEADTTRIAGHPPAGRSGDATALSPGSDAAPDARTVASPAAPSDPADHRPTLPGYEVLRVLGRGGMGIVYLARQLRANRLVALKMVVAPGRGRPEDRLRFLIEGEALAQFRHPNIVQVHEVGDRDGHPFFSLEYVAGGSLADALRQSEANPRQAAALVETIARAVHAAHQAGIIHRDLKPANILLARDPAKADGPALDGATPKVTDFGLAKRVGDESGLTQTGQVLGTPSYMAPEQARGGAAAVGVPADVYALGAILYELLTGRPPFRGGSAWDTLMQVVHAPVTPPSRLRPGLPRDLETICLKCLEKSPGDRYPSADALAEDLRRFAESRPILARPTGPARRLALWCRRRPALAALAAALVVAVGLGLAGVATQWARAEANADRARQRLDLAMDAIRRYYTGVGEDALLTQPELRDLRTRLLRPPLEFYHQLRTDLERSGRSDPEDRARLARAAADLARLTARIEPPEAAIAAFREALDAADSMALARPRDAGAARLAATVRVDLGRSLAAAGQIKEAEAALADALGRFDRLARDRPGDPDALDGRAGALVALADAELGARQLDRARRHFEEAVALGRRVADARPSDADALDHLVRAQRSLAIFYAENREQARAGALFEALLGVQTRLTALRNDDAARFDLARAYNNLGAFCVNSDRTAEAEGYFREALRIRRDLADRSPAVAAYRAELAVTQFNLGTLASNTGQHESAQVAYGRAEEIQRRLARDYPDVPLHQERLAATVQELGTEEFFLKQYDRSAARLREVVRLRERLARGRPDQLAPLAAAWRRLGDTEQMTGRTVAAAASYRAALDVYDQVVGGPNALPDDAWERADCLHNLGQLDLVTGRTERARTRLLRALEALGPLIRDHPSTPKYVSSDMNCRIALGDVMIRLRRHDDALPWFDRAAELAEAVLAKEPEDEGTRSRLAEARGGRADVLARRGAFEAALAQWDRALAAQPGPEKRPEIELGRAETLARAGDDQAATTLAESAGRADPEGAPVGVARIDAIASSHVADPARSAELRDRALSALERALAARWVGDGARLATSLAAPEFDALRDHPRFRAVAAAVSFPADPFAP